MSIGNNNAFTSSNSSLGGNSNASTVTLLAGEALGYPRVVTLVGGKAMLYDPTTAVAGNAIGITTHAALLNAPVAVITAGELEYAGWLLTANALQFAVASGLLSATPPATGLVQTVGLSLTTDKLLVNRQSPTIQI